ncbi:MAG: glycosyltransferase [Terricaulis sp.]
MDTPPPSITPASDFSVVIAALNEAGNIGAVLDEILTLWDGQLDFEIVVVDDGSTDETAAVVLERANRTPRVRLVRQAYRRGKSAALGSGAAAARGRFMVTMDADGQDDPRDALRLAQTLRDAPEPKPLVAGARARRLDGFARLLATRFANGLRRRLLNDDCPDTGCGLKAFERDLFLQFPVFEGAHRFLPALAKAHGRDVVNVRVEHRERMSGDSKYTNLGRAAVGIFDLFGVAWLISRTRPQTPRPETPAAAAKLSFGAYALLAIFALFMFLPGQSSLPPTDRDESRYAQATAQMLESGDFIDIRFQDAERHLQPAGIYWLQAISVATFSSAADREIWANRLPSLISAVLSVLLTAWIASMAFGRSAGVVAGVMMAACVLLNTEARLAKIDATLLATILAAQGLLLKAYLDTKPLKHWQAILFWALLGVGLMLKGPIPLLVVAFTILVVSLWDRKVRWLGRLRPYWLVATLAVAAPWLIAINIKTNGAFLSEAVGQSMLYKVGHAQQGHAAPPGYHLLMFPLMFWPGALLAILAAPFAWANRRAPQVRFLLSWIFPTWAMFELIATKLPHYVLPTYPAIAAITAAALVASAGFLARKPGFITGALATIAALMGLVFCALLPYAALEFDSTKKIYAVIIGVIAGALWLWTCWRVARGRRNILTLVTATLAAFVLLPALFGTVAPSLQRVWLSRQINETFARVKPCDSSILISGPYAEPSMIYLVGTDTILADGERAATILSAGNGCDVALLGGDDEALFLTAMGAAGQTPVRLGQVAGQNYSNGRDLTLTFYAGPRAETAAN